jgi:hypothetical protein
MSNRAGLSISLILAAVCVLGTGCQALSKYPNIETPGQGLLEGTVTIGPLVPVSREGVPDPTPIPEVFTSREVVVYAADGQTEIVRVPVRPGGDYFGIYSLFLPAGTYIVDINHLGIDHAAGLPATVEIIADQVTTLDIDIDTGIR